MFADELDIGFVLGNQEAARFQEFQSFSIATVENDRLLQRLKSSLTAALREGKSFADWKKTANAAFDEAGVSRLKPYHLETVWRTNSALAYSAGQIAELERVKDDFPYWQYSAVMDSRTRPSHKILHGKYFKTGDYRYFPPLGFRCRCSSIPISRRRAESLGITAPSPLSPEEMGALMNAEFIGNKNANLVAWLRRQPLTAEARQKIAPKTMILVMGISNKADAPYPRAVEPSGEKISTFVKTDALPPKAKKMTERVLNIVDSIHGIDFAPQIPVVIQKRGLGLYQKSKDGAIRISFNPSKPDAELSLLHELAHYIDNHAFGTFKPASASDDIFQEWRKIIEKIDSVKSLRNAVKNESDYASFSRYLLRPVEMWARSYSQFIAFQSQDESLIRQLDIDRKSLNFTSRFSQWTDDDFKPIYNAILSLFKEQQWTR